jgi:CRP-like cAMP-binding protein
MNMFSKLYENLKNDKKNWEVLKDSFVVNEIAPKIILLHEGETAKYVFYIRKGCLRMWFNKDGKDITTQFFFEGQPVASIDSFMGNRPGLFNIETVEPSVIISISKDAFLKLQDVYPGFRESFQEYLFQRFRNYAELFLSRIRDTPKERYDDLVKNHPEVIKRVPQHYIASYLGSLSRIRNRK